MLRPYIMNVSYACFGIYYSQISSDELPVSCPTLEETDEVCMMGGLNILLNQITIQSLTECRQFQEEEFEDLSLIRSTWEDSLW